MFNLNPTVEHEDISELKKETWRFVFDAQQGKLKLSKRFISRRKTKKHKYQVDDMTLYDTYNRRDSVIKEASQVPLTEKVMQQAKDRFLQEASKVEVTRWE